MLIPTSDNTKNVSDLRLDPVGLLKGLTKSGGPQYILYRSTPMAVLLQIDEFQKLVELAQDYLDSRKAKNYEKQDKKHVKWLNQKDFERAVSSKKR